jgi:hypothetical protein
MEEVCMEKAVAEGSLVPAKKRVTTKDDDDGKED